VTRVAAIDLGTNSTRLLVADVVDDEVREVMRRGVVTRLGEGVDARRRLLPVPVARVRNVLTDFRRELEALGAERVLAVGTSAVRDAENGEAFLGEIEWSYGFTTHLLSGDDEAALTRRGAGPLAPDALLVDVGGGSTEVSTGDFRASVDVGSVRLTERHLLDDPPTADQLGAARAAVRAALPAGPEPREAVGVAGTVAQLTALAGATSVELGRIDELTARLAGVPLDERRLVPGLDPARAPVIVGGAIVVAETLRRYRVPSIRFSVRDLLDGVALAAARLPAPAEGAAPPGAFACC
jgi:exopolyphosphatase / guanosine-5'-triphosphate,3'-diphosphate pyrophosphatase